MLVNQIAVFLENKQGRLNSLMKALANEQINVQSLNIADTSDFGIVRMVTSDNLKAMSVIKNHGFTASTVDLLGIEVADKPGTLSNVLAMFDENNIAIEYIYSFTCSEGKTLILIKTDAFDKAQKVLASHNM